MPPFSTPQTSSLPAAQAVDWAPSLEDRSRPVYIAIADAIAADIGAGRLRPGDRLPPQRILADRLGIDFTTVSRAYGEARHRGLVDARVGQGTFVRKTSHVPPPFAAEPHTTAGTVPLAVSMAMNQPPQPEDSAALTARMTRGVAAATAALGLPDLLRYPDGADSPDDREAAVRWLRHRLPGLTAERVLVAPGTQAALLALLSALARPGDTVCAEALTYPGFRAAAAQLGLRVVGVPMDADGIDPDALRAALAEHRPKALYCIPTFHNPTTATMPEERRLAVAAALREHGVPVIEDDIYGPLPESAPPPLAAFAPELTYHVAGLAKCVSPALRIAYVAAPDARQARRVAVAQRATTLIAAPLSAAIARLWIADGTAEAVRDAIRAEAMARRALAESLLPAERIVTKREAFHLWLTLPDGWTGGEFTAHLRSRGISAVAAEAFATTPDVPAALRFCLGAPLDRDETRRALEILADALVLPPATAGVII
ncbi:aminotransferase class I/II-fold pyridoxal phosphate-dependent enzyme [Azospirillum brasilense]|uniref:aminotransferase-like domain-containing protein n=1 Tax=Azospirillum brasilense TaxID=192 RepID=UPI00190B085E|nr:PLP-dependent aminotransferase family protein [Azospirillum brasilense]MBK3734004.1 aminotransferase class I/II-fold pyridoxal phosphate-dependent enzyme [Azospirillum brasilense]